MAISYVVCALWALQVMSYKVPGFPLRPIMGSLWRMVVAAAVAGEATWLVASHVGGDAGWPAVVRLVAAGVVGGLVYAGILVVLRAPELAAVRSRLPRRHRSPVL